MVDGCKVESRQARREFILRPDARTRASQLPEQ